MTRQGLLDDVRRLGWSEGVFDHESRRVSEGFSPEDARAGDWTYRVRLTPASRVLLIGEHGFSVAALVAGRCREVVVVVPDETDAALWSLWRAHTALMNVTEVVGGIDTDFGAGGFDLVSVTCDPQSGEGIDVRIAAARSAAWLTPGGTARFVVGNRWFPVTLLRGRSTGGHLALNASLSVLKESGFVHVSTFAPLPHHNRTPLYDVPLDSPGAVRAFVGDFFDALALASPEARRAHALEHMLAGIWIRFLRITRAYWLFKMAVPGYSFLASTDKPSAPKC